jgi:hypothetical protein
MKNRIVFAIIGVVSLCLLEKYAPGVWEQASRSGIGGLKSGITDASSSSKLHYLREEWIGDIRSAAAVLRYLLEPEPPALDKELVASNDAAKTPLGLGVSSPRMPKSALSNLLTPVGGLAAMELANGNPVTNQSLVASTPGMNFSPFLFNDASSMHFPDSRSASQSELGHGYTVDRCLCFNGLWCSNAIELMNTVATNSEHDPILPAKSRKPGLAEPVERPA